ncbi:CsgE family curli-type amyloid fiber assembly protein [Noviherbaspirillum sp.]|uniref:CsgE family curli-type amyloid fiber assembly protein n=1 Tax=Noviherbaspirillum sp. TaxID=1926288 RepID=UPI002D6F0279|nr:CsgE family curli-type amyloid fiber assembly protein [Noviherbaspirillum sp.]HZW20249.1 CsgE family curli-type amyloid fiber assembly protein [Noviherbaspirillum sp.]
MKSLFAVCFRAQYALAFLLTGPLHAAYAGGAEGQISQAGGVRIKREAYPGIVVDRTVSAAGHEFYRHFSAFWRDREMAQRYAISVHERPSARGGSIWVEYAQRRVFQTALPAARSDLLGLCEQAAETVLENVMEAEVQQLLFHETDLGTDEI